MVLLAQLSVTRMPTGQGNADDARQCSTGQGKVTPNRTGKVTPNRTGQGNASQGNAMQAETRLNTPKSLASFCFPDACLSSVPANLKMPTPLLTKALTFLIAGQKPQAHSLREASGIMPHNIQYLNIDRIET